MSAKDSLDKNRSARRVEDDSRLPRYTGEEARAALGRSWPIVPCRSLRLVDPETGETTVQKKPVLGAAWKQLQGVGASDQYIGWEAAMWAFVTGAGTGIVVLDADTDEALYGLKPHCGTGRGVGGHIYVQHPGWPVKTTSGVLPGLDVRGDGGMAYFFGASLKGPYRLLRAVEPYRVSDLPENVARAAGLLEPPQPKARPAAVTSWDSDGFGHPAAVRFLGQRCRAIRDADDGEWNKTYHLAVYSAAGLVAAGHLDAAFAEGALYDACDDPIEAEAVFQSSWAAGLDAPWDEPVMNFEATTAPSGPIPFPVDALPPVVARLIEEGSRSIGCPPDYLGAAALAVLGAAIGTSAEIELKGDWHERPALFVATVGEPGAKKSPAARRVMAPVYREAAALNAMAEQRRAAEAKDAEAQKRKTRRVPSARVHVDDVTMEVLGTILSENPRGVLMAADELAGWIGGMGAYKNGLGRDRQNWLSIWSGETLTVDRVKQEGAALLVPRPFVSVLGGIQPAILRKVAAGPEDGLLERLLLAQGPPQRDRWTDETVHPSTSTAYAALWNELRRDTLSHAVGTGTPRRVRLGADATATWAAWYNRTGEERDGLHGALRGIWSKMPAQCARIALILHCCTDHTGDKLSADTMEAAIRLAEYFKGQAAAIIGSLDHSSQDDRQYAAQLDSLATWIERQGGTTLREISKSGPSSFRKAAARDQALDDLAAAGRIEVGADGTVASVTAA